MLWEPDFGSFDHALVAIGSLGAKALIFARRRRSLKSYPTGSVIYHRLSYMRRPCAAGMSRPPAPADSSRSYYHNRGHAWPARARFDRVVLRRRIRLSRAFPGSDSLPSALEERVQFFLDHRTRRGSELVESSCQPVLLCLEEPQVGRAFTYRAIDPRMSCRAPNCRALWRRPRAT